MRFSTADIALAVCAVTMAMILLAGFVVLIAVRQVRRNAKRQVELLSAGVQAQESERRRIAEDMHDGLGQLLAATKLQVDGLRHARTEDQRHTEIEVIKDTLDQASGEVRNVIRDLVPRQLERGGLVEALHELTSSVNKSRNLTATFVCRGMYQGHAMPVELNLYRIGQELLANAVKHAQASSIQVVLANTEDMLELDVVDDGVGFDGNASLEGNGMRNLVNRAKLYNGRVEFRRQEPSGTQARVLFNLKDLIV